MREDKTKTTADPYGMTTKEQATAKTKEQATTNADPLRG
jgi:hypothetical protein